MMMRVMFALAAMLATACSQGSDSYPTAIKVEIVRSAEGFQLLRDGKPYVIRGAGMEVDDIERFARHGGNSIRNWTTGNDPQDIQDLLDVAHAHGVTVALCLPMRPERSGFDYGDSEAVARQRDALKADVLRYRDHPALLFWIVGNELNHSYTDPRVYDAVEDVARMIGDLDPNHPVTTAVSGFKADVIAEVQTRAPSLDFISFQLYGGLFGLADAMHRAGFEAPFMVTEWGTIGYWEMEATAWGAPVELTSSEKAGVIRRAYEEIMVPFGAQLIGSYVFKWGQKQERTPTWFGLLTDTGELTESVDVMQFLWTGKWPDNGSPRVEAMTLAGESARQSVTLTAGETYPATFTVTDPDDDPLAWRWEVKAESDATQAAGDFEVPLENIDGMLGAADNETVTVHATRPGRYRLFAYASDGLGHAAHANIPFLVTGGQMDGEEADEGGLPWRQNAEDLVAGEVMAVSYSGFREGQHPDRGAGAVNPSRAEILEDLQILAAHGFRLVRIYDAGRNTRETLEIIREHDLPLKVLLGAWLKAEVSNHEGCPWLDKPIPQSVLEANAVSNADEIRNVSELANHYADIVVAVSVGNEALIEWTDHMVPLDRVIAYVREVKAAIAQPVTVADNYVWWARDGTRLARELDFIGMHTYPQWEGKTIDEALAYTLENLVMVLRALPGKPIAILEAGWATVANEFGERANEGDQLRYFTELRDWAEAANVTVFFFEAFDEPWKGDPGNPLGAEKHWGLFNVDRTPKRVLATNPAPGR